MDKPNAEHRKLIIEAGQLLILHPEGPAGGFPMVVPVDHVSDGLHWFLGSCSPIGRGESLIVESPVQDDARYSTSATVAAANAHTFALRISPLWHRVQQRAFVRISAYGLMVRVVRRAADAQGSQSDDDAQRGSINGLLDLSAGGIRFQSASEYEHDEEVVVHFELPGSDCFVLPARVVRTPDNRATRPDKNAVAVAFTGIDEPTRAQLLRWVYREQVRRHREERRQREDR